MKEGCGNDGPWKTRKTKSRFSNVSHSPWKSPKARFPHSPNRGDDRRGKVEIQKQDFHFPTAALTHIKNKEEGETLPAGHHRRSGLIVGLERSFLLRRH
jgi:hypothetical protein